MALASERIRPIAQEELERRWALVREAMAERDVDALYMYSDVDGIGGAVRWFADAHPGGGYPTSVVFPVDAPLTVMGHGAFGVDTEISPDDPAFRGIGRQLSSPAIMCVDSNLHYDADLALDALKRLKPKRVGILHPGTIPYPTLDHIKRNLDGVEFVDASVFVDPIKAIKSPYEQEIIREICAVQVEALEFAFSVMEPGKREIDVATEVMAFSNERGSEGGVFMFGSAPLGQPAFIHQRHFQYRRLEEGDVVTFVVEDCGRGGYYGHVARVGVLGEIPQQVAEEVAFAFEARDKIVEMLVPGADPVEIAKAHDEHMVANGRGPEKRLLGHSQGVDRVERPLLRQDEHDFKIQAGMHIGVHPVSVRQGVFGFVTDNYIIGEDGAECITPFEQQVVEVS